MKKLIYLISLITVITSCQKVFLGTDEVNSPRNNFDILWEDFDTNYGLFEVRGWDWDSVYAVYSPQVTDKTTDDELWNIFTEMIDYLDDGHTSIYHPNVRIHSSGSQLDSVVKEEFSTSLVRNKYLSSIKDLALSTDDEDVYFSGKIKNKNIGYLYLNGINATNKDFMDDVLKDIGKHEAIILDIRNNFGGEDFKAEAIAERFATNSKLAYTVETRNGKNHSDFDEKTTYYINKNGEEHFSKPLIFLTDRVTISAAEVLGIYLKTQDHVTQIGDTTSGDFSTIGMRRFLPNGWQYQYSIMKFLLPDGTSLDGLGHVPDVQIRNSVTDIEAGNDKVLEKAMDYLLIEYGIE